MNKPGIVWWHAHGSITRLGGAVDHAFSGATAWLCIHARFACCTIIALTVLVLVLVLRPHPLLPCSGCCFQVVHLFQLTPALQ